MTTKRSVYMLLTGIGTTYPVKFRLKDEMMELASPYLESIFERKSSHPGHTCL